MKNTTDADPRARIVKVLRDAFGPDVAFEITKESDRVYRVRATSDRDESIADGLEKMRSDRLAGVVDADLAVKMLSEQDADEYRIRAALSDDPVARAGYEALARDARGQ